MDVIPYKVKWDSAFVYLDDIVIFSVAPGQPIDCARKVVLLLHSAGTGTGVKKGSFFTYCIDHLCHMLRSKRLEPASHATDAIRELIPLITITELRSIYGLCIVIRRFVPSFAQFTAYLVQCLRKKQPFTFSPLNSNKIDSKKALKSALMTAPVQALLYCGGHTMIDTGACDVLFGCVLLQK